MSRNDRLATVVIVLGLTPPASAHSYTVSNGRLAITREGCHIELIVRLDDIIHRQRILSHEEGLPTKDVQRAIESHHAYMLGHILLHDQNGELLSARATTARHDLPANRCMDFPEIREQRVHFNFEYKSRRPIELLTISQTLYSDGPPLFSKVSLRIDGTKSQKREIVELTNGGNVEVIDAAAMNGLRPSREIDQFLDGERFRSIRVLVMNDPDSIGIDLQIPLSVLETWIPISRLSRSAIDAREHGDAIVAIRELLHGRNTVEMEGKAITCRDEKIEIIDWRGLADRDRMNFWGARARVSLRYGKPPGSRKFKLNWGLFNSLVLEAKAVLVNGSRREHCLTAYHPTMEWSTPDPARDH